MRKNAPLKPFKPKHPILAKLHAELQLQGATSWELEVFLRELDALLRYPRPPYNLR